MVWVTPLQAGSLTCSGCKRDATSLLHDAEKIDGSSRIQFFCPAHLREHLTSHPALMERLLTNLGPQVVDGWFDTLLNWIPSTD